MDMTKRVVVSVITFLVLAVMCTPAFGQAVFGNITGTVTDPQGAAVPNAKVTVTNVRKGTTAEATSNESGNYTVTHLIPDVYDVKVEAAGFKAFEQKGVDVRADATQRVDAPVVLGAASETLEVTGEAPQLQTESADVATSYNERYVEDMPTLNRNFTQFLLMSPGTQKLTGWGHAATENPQGSQQTFVNGQHFSGTNYQLDGTDNQDPILGIIVVNPNLDAVTETKIALQNYDAEQGKAVAGFVSAQTKSGSNEFHGSGFWFRRSDANQARDPFTQYAPDPTTGRVIPQARWQQFGGSIGGPIIKNKLFFFGDYQGTRQTAGITQQTTIPDAKVRSTCGQATGFCDLTDYIGAVPGAGVVNGKKVLGGIVYDPITGDLSGAGRTPFGGEGCDPSTGVGCNMIPNARIDSASRNLLNAMPAPTNGNILNNFIGGGSGPFNQNGFDTRIDWTASSTIQVFGRFSLNYYSLSGAPDLGAVGGPGFGLLGLAGASNTHNYSLSTGVTKTFGGNWLADFRFGWFRYNPQTAKFDQTKQSAAAFGIPGANIPGQPITFGLPAFNFDQNVFFSNTTNPGNAGFGDGLSIGRCNCPLIEKEDQYQGVTNWTKIYGNHSIKFGADIRSASNLRVPSDANRTGQYSFNHSNTSDGGAGGLDFATFILGDVTSYDRFASQTINASEHQWRFFFYGQDTWRVSPKLTVNYGLRWEIYKPETVNAKGNGGLGIIQGDVPRGGVVRVAGEGPWNLAANVNNKLNAFAPRLGVAYQMNDKTVIRTGFGVSYDIGVFGSNFGHVMTQNLPVLVHQQFSASSIIPGASNNFITAFQLSTAPPAPEYPAVPANGSLPLRGLAGTVDPRIRPPTQTLPTIYVYNLTLQRQITNSMTFEIAYVGNAGHHVFAGLGPAYNVNNPAIGPYIAPGQPLIPQAQRRPFYNRWSYPGYTFTDATGTHPTPPCCSDDLGNYFGNNANNNYNSLQVKLQKQYTNGLQFIAHYTWSRALNYDNNYFVNNPLVAYGPDQMNRKQVFVFNAVYNLPFGTGQKYGGGVSRAWNYVIGGWQVTSTLNWSSGLPFTPSSSFCGQEEDVGICRPSKGLGGFTTSSSSFHPICPVQGYTQPCVVFFTPVTVGGAWRDPGLGVLGNAGFDSLWGPAYFDTDASIMKNFKLTERFQFQFRMDAFNLFNNKNYGFNSNQGNLCVTFSPGGSCGSTAGLVTDLQDATSMRALQFAIRLNF
jgi:hypothetical protein